MLQKRTAAVFSVKHQESPRTDLDKPERLDRKKNKSYLGSYKSYGNIKQSAAMESAITLLEKKFKAYEAGDYVLVDGKIVPKSASDSDPYEKSTTQDKLFDDDSEYKSPYTTDTEISSDKKTRLIADLYPKLYLTAKNKHQEIKACASDTHLSNKANLQFDAMSKIDAIANNIRTVFTEMIASKNKPSSNMTTKDISKQLVGETILNEIKRTIDKEIKIEKQLTKFLKPPKQDISSCSCNLKSLDDSMNAVKDGLSCIRSDISEFKNTCWNRIESKVSTEEFKDVTDMLKTKILQLEKKMNVESKSLKQEIHSCRDRLKRGEHGSGIKSFPLWPFLAFVGAYSIMYFGNSKS